MSGTLFFLSTLWQAGCSMYFITCTNTVCLFPITMYDKKVFYFRVLLLIMPLIESNVVALLPRFLKDNGLGLVAEVKNVNWLVIKIATLALLA